MSSDNNSLDVLSVIYAPVEQYPSSRFQAELLAERGLKVAVIDYSRSPKAPENTSTAYSKNTLRSWNRISNRLLPLDYIRFRTQVKRTIQHIRPKVVIAYDTFGFYLTGRPWDLPDPPRLIWHFHELPMLLWREAPPRMVGRAETFTLKEIGHIDLLSFPDQNRAEFLCKRLGLSATPRVAFNCPRKRDNTPSKIRDEAFSHRFGIPPDRRVVYFHGALCRSRGIPTIIQSIPKWPQDTDFLMIGPVEPDFERQIRDEAAKANVEKRVIIHPAIEYADVMAAAAQADVGVCIVDETENPTWRYSVGAINKRFEYMAVGLPQVTDDGTGVPEVVEKSGSGICVDPGSPESIANAIHRILTTPGLQKKMSQASREAHLRQYNYEIQFASLAQDIESWCNSKSLMPG